MDPKTLNTDDFAVIQQFMDDNHEWQKQTFPGHTPVSALKHLRKEVRETIESIEGEYHPEIVKTEFADCYILLLCAAKRYGIDFRDLHAAAVDKMAINRTRRWNKPNADGVVEHVRDDDPVHDLKPDGQCPRCGHPADAKEMEILGTCLDCFSNYGKEK